MKSRTNKLLRQTFYWDSPAQGAFFGLTLAGIGSWLLLSLFHFLWTHGAFGWIWLPVRNSCSFAPLVIVTFGGVALILSAYSLFLTLRSYTFFCQQRFQVWVWLFSIPLFVALSIGGIVAGARGSLLVCCITFCWLLPLLLLPKIGWRLWLGHALCWSLGLLICDIVRSNLINFLKHPFSSSGLPESLKSFYLSIQEILHLQGTGWDWFLVVGLLLLLLGYLLTARLWSRAAGLPYRQIFGRGATILWLLFGINYLFQLFLAWQGIKEANQAITALEQRFNRPLTAQALGKLYYNGEQPDSGFWQREKTMRENIESFPDEISALFVLPDEVPPEAMQQVRQHLQSIEASLSQWEEMFFGSIPPPALSYQRGHLVTMLLPHLSSFRSFSRLSHRRVRLALEDGAIDAALAACERQANANNTLLRETSLTGAIVWIACTNNWLDSLEMLLEARALSDEQLNVLANQLKATEKQVPEMHERTIYSEAVSMLDIFEMFATMTETGIEELDNCARWRHFRYFVPQLWWYGALDKANMAQAFIVSDFSEMPERPIIYGKPLFISNMLMPPNIVGRKFHSLTARLRAMQALIAAEQYRRHHGDWPKQLENLPEDPFTGEPMRYRHGDCAFQVTVAIWDEESRRWSVDAQQRSAPAVQAWSVGSDKIDGSSMQASEQTDGRRPDDIRAILRLKP